MRQLFGETTHENCIGAENNTPNKLGYRERVDDVPVLEDFITALPDGKNGAEEE